MEKRLYRSRSDRMIWGVCGGLARYFDMDPTIVRVITVLSMFLGGLGIWAYIVLALVVPLEDSKAAEPKDTIKENVEEMKETARELGREIQSALTRGEGESEAAAKIRHRRRNTLGIILIGLGALFLLGSFNLFWWFRWNTLWPLVLVAIGALIIFSVRKRR